MATEPAHPPADPRRAAMEAALAEARAKSGAGTAPEGAVRTRLKTALSVRPFRRRVLLAVLVAVAVPAVFLAGLSVYLTERITRSVETTSATYHSYVGQQVAEAFETELQGHLKHGMEQAEAAMRAGLPPLAALHTVAMRGDGFAGTE